MRASGVVWFGFNLCDVSYFSLDFNSGCIWKKRRYFDPKYDLVKWLLNTKFRIFDSTDCSRRRFTMSTHGQWVVSGPSCVTFCCFSCPRLGVEGWKPSGNKNVMWGQGRQSEPLHAARGGARSSGKMLNTPQISSLKINKAQVPHYPTRDLDQESFVKVCCGSFEEGNFVFIYHLSAIPLPCLDYRLVFHCRGLVTTLCYLYF